MEVTWLKLKKIVEENKGPLFIEFWGSWCVPCKQVEPLLKKLSEKYKDKCKIVKVNTDRNPHASRVYKVLGLPTFITMVKGNEIERKVASQPEAVLVNMIEKAIKMNNSPETTERDSEELSSEEAGIMEERLKDLGYL